MLLKMSKLTGDDNDKRCYINTSLIVAVKAIAGAPGKTIMVMANNSEAIVKKPVEEVIDSLKECGWGLFI